MLVEIVVVEGVSSEGSVDGCVRGRSSGGSWKELCWAQGCWRLKVLGC